MSVIFISHSSRDKKEVDKIVTEIKLQGFDSVFLDHDELNGIKAGEHWEQRLYDEIKRTHAILLVLSPNWINSKWCFVEYTQAKALGKEIIPIIINQGSKNEVDEWIYSYMQKSDLTKDVHALSRIIDRLKEISIHTQKGFEWDKHRLPYPGMTSFEEADAAIFFGREDETKEVIEKINAMRNKNIPKLLTIVAASGMGKSSFLKAPIIKNSTGEIKIPPPITIYNFLAEIFCIIDSGTINIKINKIIDTIRTLTPIRLNQVPKSKLGKKKIITIPIKTDISCFLNIVFKSSYPK